MFRSYFSYKSSIAGILILTILLCVSCSNKNKYRLEKRTVLNLKETYFQEWTAGAVGAGSGYSVFIIVDELANMEATVLKGIYFKNQYADFQNKEAHIYTASVSGATNLDNQDVMVTNEQPKNDIANEKSDYPFDLKEDEAVIAYTDKKLKVRYYKVVLTKKEGPGIPM